MPPAPTRLVEHVDSCERALYSYRVEISKPGYLVPETPIKRPNTRVKYLSKLQDFAVSSAEVATSPFSYIHTIALGDPVDARRTGYIACHECLAHCDTVFACPACKARFCCMKCSQVHKDYCPGLPGRKDFICGVPELEVPESSDKEAS